MVPVVPEEPEPEEPEPDEPELEPEVVPDPVVASAAWTAALGLMSPPVVDQAPTLCVVGVTVLLMKLIRLTADIPGVSAAITPVTPLRLAYSHPPARMKRMCFPSVTTAGLSPLAMCDKLSPQG